MAAASAAYVVVVAAAVCWRRVAVVVATPAEAPRLFVAPVLIGILLYVARYSLWYAAGTNRVAFTDEGRADMNEVFFFFFF